MKSMLAAFMVIFIAFATMGQVKKTTKEDLERFLKSKTYVVLEGTPFSAFNDYVNEQFSKAWTITPFEVISFEEFEQKCGDAKSSFLLVAEARFDETRSALFRSKSDVWTESDTYTYDILTLVMGDPSKKINNMPDLASVPIAYEAIEEDEAYAYKMGVIIYFMQFYTKYCSNNPGNDIRDIIKENAGKIKDYELWLRAEELSPEVNTAEKISRVYPYKVKITTAEEIEKAISEKNPKVALLHKIGPEGAVGGDTKCWKFIVTAAEGNPLYFESHKISDKKPDALLEEDFVKMGK